MTQTFARFDTMLLNQSIIRSSSDISIESINRRISQGRLRDEDHEPEDDQTETTTVPNPLKNITKSTYQSISSSYPNKNKQEVKELLADLLSGYWRIEKRFSITRYDVAGAVAAFLAGSYMAYHNVDFPDQDFPPLVRQMRRALGATPRFVRASNAEKQEMYEHLAILGMFMATTQMALKERPDPQIAASMRQAAKGYLEQFLKTDADRVKITRAGLIIQ